jgi:hypothetical protein
MSERTGRGLWRDEQRRPGFFPQGRRAPIAIISTVGVYFFARWMIRDVFDRRTLGIFVISVGLTAFWNAARMNEQRLAQERYTRGPGFVIGWMISKTSVGFARAFYILLGLGICALGALTLAV